MPEDARPVINGLPMAELAVATDSLTRLSIVTSAELTAAGSAR
ncbi:hypothetical protein [Nocardia tenerifensis]|nr:hypothetical protein [Nocardia tenerifensis]